MAQRGFTLVELLVVLAIAVMLVALAAPVISRSLPGAELKTAASDVAGGLRRVQSQAIVTNREAVFQIDVASRRAVVGSEARALALPRDLRLNVVVGDTEVANSEVGGIRFFPDGSSTGGRITLALAGQAYDVRVDWLTGRVMLEGPHAAPAE